jgi:MOFRL family
MTLARHGSARLGWCSLDARVHVAGVLVPCQAAIDGLSEQVRQRELAVRSGAGIGEVSFDQGTQAAALAMEGMEDSVLLAAGTDGPTDAAGAIADGKSAARAQGVDPAARLADNDSNPVFARLGDLVVTGPTNTNLLDLYLLLLGSGSGK